MASVGIENARARGGITGTLARAGNIAKAGIFFARMYFMKPRTNELPATIRMQPVW
jgi:magnesium-protoporphyrin IX monomethyl ester (oxidative) cyclase